MAGEIVSKHAQLLAHWARLEIMRQRIRSDPNRRAYMDDALTPVTESETETLELFTHNASAGQAVKHIRHIDELTHAGGPHPVPPVHVASVPHMVATAEPAE
jgi:hypothetical protein